MTYYTHWDELYRARASALQDSDWTQGADSPLSDEKKAEWAAYRQALRDISLRWSPSVNKRDVNPYDTPNLFPQQPQ